MSSHPELPQRAKIITTFTNRKIINTIHQAPNRQQAYGLYKLAPSTTRSLWGKCYHPHFTSEKIEAWWDKDIYPPPPTSKWRSRSWISTVWLQLDLFTLFSALQNTEQLLWWLEKATGRKALGKQELSTCEIMKWRASARALWQLPLKRSTLIWLELRGVSYYAIALHSVLLRQWSCRPSFLHETVLRELLLV